MNETTKSYTENQIRELCRDAHQDMASDGIDIDGCAYDVAQNLITDIRVQKYFINRGIKKEFWAELLADLIA